MNEEKFTGKAKDYEKYWPTYPKEFIQYLYTEIGFSKKSVIADVGSGTGILAELLLQEGSFVIGVEPNNDMRSIALNKFIGNKNYTSINSTAEHINIQNNSIDFVTAAMAFHLFDKNKFKEECQRILKDGGKVVIVEHNRDRQSESNIKNIEIDRFYCPGYNNSIAKMKQGPDDYIDFFSNGICENRVFRYDTNYDENSFIKMSLSSSFSPKEGDENYNPYVLALKQLFKNYNNSGILCIPNFTRSYIGEVK